VRCGRGRVVALVTFTAWPRPEPDTTPPGTPSGTGNDEFSSVITARTNCNQGNWQFYDRLGSTLYISK